MENDPFDSLDDLEKDYVNIQLNDIKLSPVELEAKFGDRLMSIRADMKLREIVANEKIKKKSRKNLIDQQKLEKMVELNPIALKGILEIAQHGKEHNKLQACMFLLRPAVAYLEKQAMRVAEIESMDGNEDKFNFTLNVTPIDAVKSN